MPRGACAATSSASRRATAFASSSRLTTSLEAGSSTATGIDPFRAPREISAKPPISWGVKTSSRRSRRPASSTSNSFAMPERLPTRRTRPDSATSSTATTPAARARRALARPATSAGRGVLLDVAGGHRLDPDYAITPDDLEQAERAKIRHGDVVLVRTGYGALWSKPDEYLKAAGVSAAGTRWLIEKKVRVVGADNMAFDVMAGPKDPDLNDTFPAHVLLLVREGIPIIENLNLEELAAAKVYEFAFFCLPLKMRGATGSPVRPIAVA